MNPSAQKPSNQFAFRQLFEKKHLLQGLLFLAPVVFLIPFLNGFIYAHGADFNDLAISHYPNALWIQQSIRQWGEIPLWSNTILSGYPFSADPLAGLFYFPGWPGLLLPLPFGLNLMMVLHLIWGGIGMYFFLRTEGVSRWPAMAGALAFESMPKLFAHIGSGHLTLIYAVVWTPWLILAQSLAMTSSKKFRLLPGVILGLIVLADVRWVVLAGLLWAAYGAYRAANSLTPGMSRNEKLHKMGMWLLNAVGNAALALGLGAALLIPLADFTALSTRSLMTVRDVLTLSMPWGQLIGLFVPYIGGFAEWMTYTGTLVVILCGVGLGMRNVRQKSTFWWGVAIVGLIYALGENIPGMTLVAALPGFNLVRVPARGLFVSEMALILIATFALQGMVEQADWGFRLPKLDPLKGLVGLTFFVILLIPAIWVATKTVPLRFIWAGVGLTAGLAVIFRAKSKKLRANALAGAAIALLLIDLGGVNALGFDFHSVQDVTNRGSGIIDLIEKQANADFFRVYSPSYSLPQQTAALHKMEQADGVDPLQLKTYSQLMASASGVPNEGYSVTLPPFKNGETGTDNQSYHPDAQQLGWFNVAYLASEFKLDDPALVLIGKVNQTFVYKNTAVLPRAWVQQATGPLGEEVQKASILKKSANTIEIGANGPGRLVVSEVNYPGWKAWVDGKPVEIQPVEGVLRGVDLDAGAHIVRMAYQPVDVYAGMGISLVLWLFVIWMVGIRNLTGKRGTLGNQS